MKASAAERRPEARGRALLGVLWITLGAACYGVLATLVELSFEHGFSPAEVTSSQFVIGAFVLAVSAWLSSARRTRAAVAGAQLSARPALALLIAGTSIGFTGAFYYLAVAKSSVSFAIVMLMQSVWISVLLDSLLERRAPKLAHLGLSLVVIGGTLLATGVLQRPSAATPAALAYGLASAFGYSAVLWSNKHIGAHVEPIVRSALMVTGGMIAALALTALQRPAHYDIAVFWKWGWIVALFGTILPPFFFAKGAPLIGLSLTAILSAIELPLAILSAHVVLGEQVSPLQWIGVALIVAAIALANVAPRRTRASATKLASASRRP